MIFVHSGLTFILKIYRQSYMEWSPLLLKKHDRRLKKTSGLTAKLFWALRFVFIRTEILHVWCCRDSVESQHKIKLSEVQSLNLIQQLLFEGLLYLIQSMYLNDNQTPFMSLRFSTTRQRRNIFVHLVSRYVSWVSNLKISAPVQEFRTCVF